MNDQQLYYEQKLRYEIDAWDLNEAMKQNEAVIVIDARSTQAYELEHIPGAVSFPHRTMSAESTASLDKSALYVTYCDGIGCNASTKGALNLLKLGFKVKELLGGIDWWKRDGYPTEGTAANNQKEISCGY
jgi:rhodanese-related sulfurtransferase